MRLKQDTPKTSPAFPIRPSLKTQWVRLDATPANWSVGCPISVASDDGSLWRSGPNKADLWRYENTPIGGVWLPKWSGRVLSLSARSATQAWGVFADDVSAQAWVGFITDEGGSTRLPAPPSPCVPARLSASLDNTLWVLSEQGAIFSYDHDAKTWAAIDTSAHKIATISVGSRSNIWALEFTEKGSVVLQHNAASGWQVVQIPNTANVFWIGACADGAVWAGSVNKVMLRRSGAQTWESYDNPGLMGDFAASSRQGLMGVGGIYETEQLYFGVLTTGIVDQPGADWPSQTPGQRAAYEAISKQLGINADDGVRGEYTNETNPFTDWHTDVAGMKCPDGIAPNDFAVIQNQIGTELEYVTTVYNLFQHIDDLNANIQIVNDTILPAVAGMVGLTETPDDKNLVIDAVLSAVFQGVVNKLISMIPFPGNLAVGLAYAGIRAGIDAATKGPKPPDFALAIQYAHLAETLASIYVQAEQANARYKEQILTNWGRLRAVHDGDFRWPTTASSEIAAHAKPDFELSFYQMLMPAKWQIVHVAAWPVNMTGRPPATCPLTVVPGYCTYQESRGESQGWLMFEVWFCNKLGAKSEGCEGFAAGPFPAKALIAAIDNIEGMFVDMRDFFKGQRGWSLNCTER